MYEINQDDLPEEFLSAWYQAGSYLQSMGQGGVNWLRANLNKPFIEHLSFRFGNKLFFIFVEIESVPLTDSQREIFISYSNRATAIPCVFTMKRVPNGFEPTSAGWGLIDASTQKPINPLVLVSDELIEISDWECNDLGIQIVKNYITYQGHEILSSQSALDVDPSIWFKDKDTNKSSWVVVRSVRYPLKNAKQPDNIQNIKSHFEHESKNGYFASISIANTNDPFDPTAESTGNFLPIYRGHPVVPKFDGLVEI